MKAPVKNLNNETVGEIDLADDIFGLAPRADLLARMVNWQMARRQRGTHKTKGISEIQGTGKKPYRQKGTGNARQGSLRSPQFRGGAVIFGPVVRSHAHDLNKKVRKLALKTALSVKARDGKLIILEEARADSHKTKEMAPRLSALGITSALIIDGAVLDEKFALSVRNIPLVDLLPEQGANVRDILRRDTLVLTRAAVASLEARLRTSRGANGYHAPVDDEGDEDMTAASPSAAAPPAPSVATPTPEPAPPAATPDAAPEAPET